MDVTSPKLGRFVCEGQSTYYIFIEGVILCSCNSFTKGFYLWFCSHYVFNLSYHKYNHDAAMFIQEFVIGLPKSQKKSANYLTVATEIVNMTKWHIHSCTCHFSPLITMLFGKLNIKVFELNWFLTVNLTNLELVNLIAFIIGWTSNLLVTSVSGKKNQQFW